MPRDCAPSASAGGDRCPPEAPRSDRRGAPAHHYCPSSTVRARYRIAVDDRSGECRFDPILQQRVASTGAVTDSGLGGRRADRSVRLSPPEASQGRICEAVEDRAFGTMVVWTHERLPSDCGGSQRNHPEGASDAKGNHRRDRGGRGGFRRSAYRRSGREAENDCASRKITTGDCRRLGKRDEAPPLRGRATLARSLDVVAT
jgi:hypothetical protein